MELEYIKKVLSAKDIEDVFAGDFKKSTIDYMNEKILEDFFHELARHTYNDRSQYEIIIKELFKKYKLNVNKATLVHYYRMMLNKNKIISIQYKVVIVLPKKKCTKCFL
jgi:hypothetical protein